MEGKKRYIAIILFLLICLMVFTFATTGDEELEKDGNGSNIQEVTDKDNSTKEDEDIKSEDEEESKEENKGNNTNSNSTNKDSESSADDEEDLDGTGEVDNSAYDKALEAVEELERLLTDAQADIARDLVEEVTNSDQYKELMERVEDAEDAIDAEELVAKLEQMVKDAAKKADITDAKDFRDEEVTDAVNEIDGENLEDVKEDLLDRIEELSKILDDNNDPTIDGIKDGEYTNLDEVSLTITDENEVDVKVTKDGKEIDFAEKFTEEGTYEVTVVDAAFNDVTKTFTIDRTEPKFEGLTSGNHYDVIKLDVKDSSPVRIMISQDHAKEITITNGTEITEDGTYRIVATDEAGNKKEIWVAIDSTKPTIEPDVEYTNVKGQKVTIADKFLMTVTINGKEYTRSDFAKDKNNENFSMEYTLEEDGEYTIIAKDKKGLTVEKTIILDTVKPAFDNLASREVDTDYYKVEVTDATPVKIYVSKNHKAFEEIQEGYELTEEATYQLKAVDAAGNEFTTWIHIDKTAPTITVTPDKEYMNVCPTIEVFDRYLSTVTIDGKVYDRKDFTKNSSNENFKLNVTLEDCVDGLHTITAVDKKGHSVTKTFTVDTKAPTYKFYKEGSSLEKDEIQPKIIKGKLYFDQNVRVVFEEETSYFTQYIHNDFVNNENKTTIKRWQREATNDGEHTMKVTDALGHVTEVTFTIDTKAPTYKFYKEGSSLEKDEIQPKIIKGKLYFDQNVRVVFEEESSYFTQYIHNDFVNNENKTTIKRWQREALNDGEHTMKVTDALGQATEVTFTVDTTKAEINVETSNKGNSTNQDVTVTLTSNEPIVTPEGWTVVEEGIKFTKVHKDNGKFKLTVKDLVGNETLVNYEVKRIDRVAPTATVTTSNNGGFTNKDVTVTIFTNEAIRKPAGWTSIETTKKEHEFSKVYTANGNYEVEITDKAGNKSIIPFTVTGIDKKAPKFAPEKWSYTLEADKDTKFVCPDMSQYVTDEYSGVKSVVVDKWFTENWSIPDQTKPGKFTCRYISTDNAGNSVPNDIFYTVVDTVAPKVTNVTGRQVSKGQATQAQEITITIEERVALDKVYYAFITDTKDNEQEIIDALKEKNLVDASLIKENEDGTYSFTIKTDFEGSRRLIVKAVDKAGNVSGYQTKGWYRIDTTPIAVKSANMYTNGKVYGDTYYATKGQTITAYVRLYEKSETLPVITLDINGTKVVLDNVKESFHNDADKAAGIYKYEGTYTIPEDMEVNETEVTYSVTNISDKAGNKTTVNAVTNDNIIMVDTTIPKITTINIRGGGSVGTGAKTTYYAKKGAIIYLNVFFKEELPVKPVFVLNGTKVVNAGGPKYDANSKTYNYFAAWELTDELAEGLIKVEVKDFSDKAGNTTTYKLEEHKMDSQSRVIVDNTAPTFRFTKSGSSLVKDEIEPDIVNGVYYFYEPIRITINDNYNLRAHGINSAYDDKNPARTGWLTELKEDGEYIAIGTDTAGARSEIKIVIITKDETAPIITLLGEKDLLLEVGEVYNESGVKVIDNKDGESTLTTPIKIEFYDLNDKFIKEVNAVDTATTGKYVLTYQAKDAAGNESNKVKRTIAIYDKVIENANDLKELFSSFNNIKNKIAILKNDIDMSGVTDWKPVMGVDTYTFTLEGNGRKISNLVYETDKKYAGLFFEGMDSGDVIIKNLTIENSKVKSTANDSYVGLIGGYIDVINSVNINNVHIVNSEVSSTNYAGAFLGWTAGYNTQNDGPVDGIVNIINCSVKGTKVIGGGSAGLATGHAGANPGTYTTIKNFVAEDNIIKGERVDKTGAIIGTANMGIVVLDNIKYNNNTVFDVVNSSKLVGRFVPAGTGKLTQIVYTSKELTDAFTNFVGEITLGSNIDLS